jgi:cobalt/nickel transport protein
MKKHVSITVFIAIFIIATVGVSSAHFQMIIPSDDIVGQAESRNLDLKLMFTHPFEGHYMNMDKPTRFGVWKGGETENLLDKLALKKKDGFSMYEVSYKIKRPGDHIFFVEPAPYWEPAEDCFIIHYTKVIVNSMGMEEGWDEELGLKTEIVPLTRPYGLYSGNVFQGIVKVDGKPVPYSEVEVEYYNEGGKFSAPADPFVTQVVKADGNGVFTYAMPRAGWWGFAALNTDSKQIKGPDGKMKDVEIGAVFWVKTHEMK